MAINSLLAWDYYGRLIPNFHEYSHADSHHFEEFALWLVQKLSTLYYSYHHFIQPAFMLEIPAIVHIAYSVVS